MDPVSSALGIISFAGAVAQKIKTYYANYKDCPKRALAFKEVYERKAAVIFKILQYQLYDENLKNNKALSDLFEEVKKEAEDLDDILNKPPKKSFKSRYRKFRSMISTAPVDTSLAKLSKVCQELSDRTDLVVLAHTVNTKNMAVVHWISDYPFDDRRQEMYQRYQPNTLKWVLEKPNVQSWALDSQALTTEPGSDFYQSPILWFKGEPGVGKSVLASLITSKLKEVQEKNTNFGLLYFFFHFEQVNEQQSEHVIRSLARQAVQQYLVFKPKLSEKLSEPLPEALLNLYDKYFQGRENFSQDYAISLLNELLPKFDRSYIIIDGLDEYSQRESVIKNVPAVLSELIGIPNNNTRLMVTSRFSSTSLATTSGNLKFDEINLEASREDMSIYIESSIARSQTDVCRQLNQDQAAKAAVVNEILYRSGNQFQLAARGFELLRKSGSRMEFYDSMNNVSDEMYSSYSDSILRIDSRHTNSAANQRQEPLGIKALAFVLHAQERFTVPQMQHLLAIRPGRANLSIDDLPEPEFIVQSTMSLVVSTKSGHFQFSHKTVAEFLRSPNQIERFNNLQIVLAQSLNSYMVLAAGKSVHGYPLIPYCKAFQSHHLLFYLYRKIYPDVEQSAAQRVVFRVLEGDFGQKQQDELLKNQNIGDLSKLHYAAILGAEDLVIQIVRNDRIPIDVQDSLGCTPLHMACAWNRPAMARALLVNQASIHIHNTQGQTPLHIGCKMGFTDIVKMLVSRKADCNIPDGNGLTALHYAFREGNLDIIQLLLDVPGIDINMPDLDGNTVLFDALKSKNIKAVQQLVRIGADLNHRGPGRATLLIHAAMKNETGVGRMLVQSGANVDLQQSDGLTALHCAADQGNMEFVKLLVSSKARLEVADNDGHTPLFKAVKANRMDVVKFLLVSGASIKKIDNNGESMLFHPAQHKWLEMSTLVVESGCPISHVANNGRTALHWVGRMNAIECLEMLLKNGIDVHVSDSSGETALYLAAYWNLKPNIDMLLEYGSSASHADNANETMLFCNGCDVEVGTKLLARGCPIDHINKDGQTALHWGARNHDAAYVQMLLDHGADDTITDKNDETALCFAVYRGRKQNIDVLLAHGSSVTHINGENETLLFYNECDAEIAAKLIKRGCPVDHVDKHGRSALHWGATNHDSEFLKVLLDNGADIQLEDNGKETALWRAVSGNHRQNVETLLARGARMSHVNNSGENMLFNPARKGWVELGQLVIDHGEDIHFRDTNQETALFPACHEQKTEYAEMLIDNGIEIDAQNNKGETAMFQSCRSGRAGIVAMLVRRGADIHAIHKDGESLIGVALRHGHLDVIKALVDGGANPHEVDANGKNLLHYAAEGDRMDVVTYLLKKGVNPLAVDSHGQTPYDKSEKGEMRMLLESHT